MSLGTPRVHHRLTDSTNAQARELALAGAPHGTLVTADEQTAGRGRSGRTWSARPGSGLLMSLLIRDLTERHAMLPLAAAVAICEALPDVPCRIKWPNDIWVDQRKLAGILIEGRPQEGWAVIGIGLNVSTRPEEFPDELRDTATSLLAVGVSASREALLEALLTRLAAGLDAPHADILSAWRSRDALKGTEITWDAGSGTAAGIDDEGSLLVDTAEGRVALGAGEVHLGRVG